MIDDDLTPQQRRHRAQSAGARAARITALARSALPVDRLEVFVLRDEHRFRWEIRRYGAVVVERGTEHFRSAAEARCSGEAALSAMLMQAVL